MTTEEEKRKELEETNKRLNEELEAMERWHKELESQIAYLNESCSKNAQNDRSYWGIFG